MSENSTIKQRIYLLIEALGTNARQFSLTVSKSDSFVRNINENIGSDKIKNILLNYPDVNLEWLIAGEGEMFKSKKTTSDEELYKVKSYLQASEDEVPYGSPPKAINEKIQLQEKIINSQEETIRLQKETIEQLKRQLNIK